MTDTTMRDAEHVPPNASGQSASLRTATLSAATRYLAAAAYIDAPFRYNVLRLVNDVGKARAPELGIDEDVIINHCYSARRRKAFRSLVLCLSFLPLIISDFFDYISDIADDPSLAVTYFLGAILCAWLISFVVTFIEIVATEYFILSRELRNPRAQSMEFIPDNTRSELDQNVVVYGGFSPFVGSGVDLGGWSFAVNLELGKPGSGEHSQHFEIGELYASLRQSYERLDPSVISVKDRLYIDGRAIRNDERFLPHILARPTSVVDEQIVEAFRDNPGKAMRHYLCIEATDWGGELVLSNFIRAQKTASKLFIEQSTFLLPPLKESYYQLDNKDAAIFLAKLVQWTLLAIITGPFLAIASPFIILNYISQPLTLFLSKRRIRKEIKRNPMYNYGATQSIRELGMENRWRVYFQKLDREMHGKIIQQQTLDSLVAFLDEHGVDTTEIKDRGSQILNNGLIVSGGMISAESLAVGAGAKARTLDSTSHRSVLGLLKKGTGQ